MFPKKRELPKGRNRMGVCFDEKKGGEHVLEMATTLNLRKKRTREYYVQKQYEFLGVFFVIVVEKTRGVCTPGGVYRSTMCF